MENIFYLHYLTFLLFLNAKLITDYSDFRRKRNGYAWNGFLFRQFLAVEVLVLNK